MPKIISILLFFLVSLFSYFFSISTFTYLSPQIIALFSIAFLVLSIFKRPSVHLLALIVNLIIFSTNSLNSPFFFLIYFLLFIIAFQNLPSITLSYSLFLVLIFAQSLSSFNSAIVLSSMLLVTPLAWFIGKEYLDKRKIENSLTQDETDIFLWFSLNFKTAMYQILDSCSELLSQPQLLSSQKDKVKKIKDSAKSILKSSEKLTQEIDQESDEN